MGIALSVSAELLAYVAAQTMFIVFGYCSRDYLRLAAATAYFLCSACLVLRCLACKSVVVNVTLQS